MSRMRLRIAERLKQSQNAAASLTTFNEIDMSSLMDMRKKYKDDVLKEQGVKLGFMSAFAKACCHALREIPAANASIEDDTIVYRDYVDLSVAVATPKGLVTPVVRNAESMSFVDIEREISNLGKKVSDWPLSGLPCKRLIHIWVTGAGQQAHAGRYGRGHIHYVSIAWGRCVMRHSAS